MLNKDKYEKRSKKKNVKKDITKKSRNGNKNKDHVEVDNLINVQSKYTIGHPVLREYPAN